MRDSTRDDGTTTVVPLVPGLGGRPARRLAMSSEEIAAQRGELHPLFSQAMLHARLALVRPRPVRLRPAKDGER